MFVLKRTHERIVRGKTAAMELYKEERDTARAEAAELRRFTENLLSKIEREEPLVAAGRAAREA